MSRVFKRAFIVLFSLIILTFSTLFLFRQTILAKTIEYFLTSYLPKNHLSKLTYDEMKKEEGKFILSNVQLIDKNYEMLLDRIEFKMYWDWKDFSLQTQLILVHPQLNFSSSDFSFPAQVFLGASVPTRFHRLTLDVYNGVMQLGEQRLYFGFQSNQENPQALGTFFVSHDPSLLDLPFLIADFEMREEKLFSQLKVNPVDAFQLMNLLSLVSPKLASSIHTVQGQADLQGNMLIDLSGRIEQLSCQFHLQNLEYQDPTQGMLLKAAQFEGGFHYFPQDVQEEGPFWRQFQADMIVHQGEMQISNQWMIKDIEGKIFLDASDDPQLSMKGNLLTLTQKLALELNGKGSVHADSSFWLELALQLSQEKMQPCTTFLSLCRPEKDLLILQAELKNASHEQCNLLQDLLQLKFNEFSYGQLLSGNVRGKFMSWIEKNQLARIEIQDFLGENLRLQTAKGQVLDFPNLKLEAEVKQMLPELEGEFNIQMNLPSYQLAGLFSQELQEQFYTHLPSDLSVVYATIKSKGEQHNVSGTLDFVDRNETIQFGYEATHFTPNEWDQIQDAWIRCPNFVVANYMPLLNSFLKGVQLEGNLDIFGTFDGSQLQLSIQGEKVGIQYEAIRLEIPSLGEKDPMLLQTKGRAKFTFDPIQHQTELLLPLNDVKFMAHHFPFAFNHLNADLHFIHHSEASKLTATIHEAKLGRDQLTLIHEMKFILDANFRENEVSIKNCVGQINISEDLKYRFNAEEILLKDNEWKWSAKVFDHKEPILKMFGMAPLQMQEMRASLEFTDHFPIKGKCFAVIQDQNEDKALIEIRGRDLSFFDQPVESFECIATSEKGSFVIEKLQADSLLFGLKMVPEGEHYVIPLWKLQIQDAFFAQGQGVILWDLASLNFQAQLGFDVEAIIPTPLQLHTKKLFKCAFSPDVGFVVSDFDLMIGQSEVEIGHMEYMMKTKKWHGRECVLHVPQSYAPQESLYPLFSLLGISANSLKNVNFQLDIDETTFKALGHLQEPELPFEIAINLASKGGIREGILKINQASDPHPLSMSFSLTQDFSMVWRSLSGSIYGMQLELNRGKSTPVSEILSGKISGDFKRLAYLFPSSVAMQLQSWQFGEGYEISGDWSYPYGSPSDFQFKGKLIGKTCQFVGCYVKKMETSLTVLENRIQMDDLQLKDDALAIEMKNMVLARAENNSWFYEIPSLRIQGFKPDLLMTVEKKTHSPFVIKQAEFTQIRGKFDDLKSLSGYGVLTFISSAKNFVLFDIQERTVQEMGLNASSFTPISGEIKCAFQDGKCILTALKDVYGDGKQLEFALTPERLAYLDFEGNLHLDLMLKNRSKNALEPFSVSIRGTVENPRLETVHEFANLKDN